MKITFITAVVLMIVQSLITGCGEPYVSDFDLKQFDIIAKCDNITNNGFIAHQVVEIWKDSSSAKPKYLKGDLITPNSSSVKKNVDYGKQSILFFKISEGHVLKTRNFPVHDGFVGYPLNLSIGEVETLVKKNKN